jgi:hypothetical protein
MQPAPRSRRWCQRLRPVEARERQTGACPSWEAPASASCGTVWQVCNECSTLHIATMTADCRENRPCTLCPRLGTGTSPDAFTKASDGNSVCTPMSRSSIADPDAPLDRETVELNGTGERVGERERERGLAVVRIWSGNRRLPEKTFSRVPIAAFVSVSARAPRL